MMASRAHFNLNEQTTKSLNVVYNFLQKNPELYDGKLDTKSSVINQLLSDYLSVLMKKWNKNHGVFYSDIKRTLIKEKVDPEVKQLIKLERSLMDRVNMLLYLTMDTNSAIVRADNQSYLRLTSMYKAGTTENDMFSKLADLVQEDNQKLFKQARAKRSSNLMN